MRTHARAQHTERLDDDRAEYEERLAEAAVLVRKACQYDAARLGETRPLMGL